jgi:hypothetical protein
MAPGGIVRYPVFVKAGLLLRSAFNLAGEQNMLSEEIRDDADLPFIGKTDAQILRELYGVQIRTGRRRFFLPDEQSEYQDEITGPDDEAGSQAH